MTLPTEKLKQFFDKIIIDTSTENIIEQLEGLTEDEIYSLRNFIQQLEILSYDRITVIDKKLDEEFKQSMEQLDNLSIRSN